MEVNSLLNILWTPSMGSLVGISLNYAQGMKIEVCLNVELSTTPYHPVSSKY